MSFSERQPKNESDNAPNISTGPIDAGKSNSSKNAMKHGCCAVSTLLIEGENPEDLKALEVTWLKVYNPSTDAERHLIQELANQDWLLQRVTRAHASIESQLYASTPNPMDWTEQQERKLSRHLRYKTAQTNIVNKCRKAVEDFRKARASEKANVEKANIAQERLRVFKEKNRPEPTWKEHIENMRRQAQALGLTKDRTKDR